jgi:hypothetical protein
LLDLRVERRGLAESVSRGRDLAKGTAAIEGEHLRHAGAKLGCALEVIRDLWREHRGTASGDDFGVRLGPTSGCAE